MTSSFVRHEPCPKCGSRNNLARYSDGHATCFSGGCDYYEKGNGQVIEQGNHTELLNNEGAYSVLYDSQFKN